MQGAPLTAWGRLPEVSVSARGPFAVGSVLWRDARGALMCTIVAKATYELIPGESPPSEVPLPIQEEDAHWDDDPSRSVHQPGDLAPFKSAAEVVVVGSAFAPGDRAARSVVARVVVGSVDKAVECFPARRFRSDGTIDDASPQVRFSLRWEHAAGGPGTDNPAGIDVTRGDARGRCPIPPLLPPSFQIGGPGEHVPLAGLGPIAASWPSRLAGLGPHDRAWIRRPAASPLPPTLPARAFQNAPEDQWLDRPLVANERIVLENLHEDNPRLVMSLSGIEPRALVAGQPPVRLSGDMLFIDSDRTLCTLTFRGQIAVGENVRKLAVVVTALPMGEALSAGEVRRLLDEANAGVIEIDDAVTEPRDAVISTTAMPMAWMAPRAALPFPHSDGGPRAKRVTFADGALPFRGERDVPATDTQPPPPIGASPIATMAAPLHVPTAAVPFTTPALSPLPPAVNALPPLVNAPPLIGAPPPVINTPPPVINTPLPVINAPPPLINAPPPLITPPAAVAAPAPPAPVIAPPAPVIVPAPVIAPPPFTAPAPSGLSVGQQAASAPAASLSVGQQAAADKAPPPPAAVSLGRGALSGNGPSAPAVPALSAPSIKAPSIEPAPIAPADKPAPEKPATKVSSFDAAFGGGKSKAPAKGASSFEAAFGAKPKQAIASKPTSLEGGFGGAAKAASDAAADQERAKEPPPKVEVAPPVVAAPRRLTVVDLLHHEPKVAPRLRTMKRFAALWAQPAARVRAVSSVDEPRAEPASPDRDRADVLRVLSYARPVDFTALRAALSEGLEEHGDLEPPVVLLGGELRPTFDELDTLRTTVAVAQPVAGTDKKLLAALGVAQEALAASVPPRADATLGLARQIEQASLSLSLPPRYVAAEVERLLLEHRKWKRRALLGQNRVRAELVLADGEALIAYLPEAAAMALPLLHAYPVMALCQPRPREDLGELREDSVFVVAVGRVLKARAESVASPEAEQPAT